MSVSNLSQFKETGKLTIPSGGNPLRANETGGQIRAALVAGEEYEQPAPYQRWLPWEYDQISRVIEVEYETCPAGRQRAVNWPIP
jgi:hypothetical protein